MNSEDIKKFALACGADAVGIGSMDRFEGAPPEMVLLSQNLMSGNVQLITVERTRQQTHF